MAVFFISVSQVDQALASPIRGISGDLWADIEIGERDFTEISAREIVPYKLNEPGGIIVDRSTSPGRAYIWDSGNNRILGVDLNRCYGQDPPCQTEIVIGQPSGSDYGACNLDSSFQTYPNRPPSSASTLCGVPEWTQTVLEDKSFTNMYIDNASTLWVPDFRNNRVLKYLSPFTTDVVADEVWGQSDFSGNRCNFTQEYNGDIPQPTNSSLCFFGISTAGAGVTLDQAGNLWIADGGNNRVLRFPKQIDGSISKTADLVLGQPDFTSRQEGTSLNQMKGPAALRFDSNGILYVVETYNNRVTFFAPPFVTGMPATDILISGISNPQGLETDANGKGIWVIDLFGKVQLWDTSSTNRQMIAQFDTANGTAGSLGIDSLGNVLVSTYLNHNVYRFAPTADGYVRDRDLFYPGGYNLSTARRLEHPSWGGVTVTDNQLIIADSRLLFWDNPQNLTNGQAPAGFFPSKNDKEIFLQTKTDAANRVWTTRVAEILVYQSPLTTTSQPLTTIKSPVPVLGGGEVVIDDAFYGVRGLAPTIDGKYLWISQTDQHRVLRIRDPLTNPVVDIILGQLSLTGNQCNRGQIPAPNAYNGQVADLTMLCYPGAISFDQKGNLYISDHFPETAGNWRLLMFASENIPTNPLSIQFAIPATKEFPWNRTPNPYTHMIFEPAFNSANIMVVGLNPVSSKRFVEYYLDPTKVNPNNPSDYDYAAPDGQLNDYYGWPIAATFDKLDNLYMYDANRGKVLIYKHPFSSNSSPTPTPSPAFSAQDLKNLFLNYLTFADSGFRPVDQKVNMLDGGFVIEWLN